MICHYFEEPSYLFFAPDLPTLLYYSHIPVSILALLVGLFVFFNNPKRLINRLLLVIAICFSLWTTINLVAWTNIHSDFILFLWPFFGILTACISIFSIYFIYAFLDKKDVALWIKSIFLTMVTPVLLFAHTDLSVSGFNISDCDAFGFEGFWYNAYYTGLGAIAMVWIFTLLITRYRIEEKAMRRQIVLMGIGMELFLLMFFTITYIASYLANLGLVDDSQMEMYGLFGMAIFMVFIGILMVKHQIFRVGLIAAQALVVGLIVLIGSQFTFTTSTTSSILTAVTLFLTGITGLVLVRSVHKEITQRQELEKLTQELEKANVRLKALDKLKSEFVSIASHQLRSPLTSIRGYASLLVEGSFGAIPENAKEPLERIESSAKNMALAVEDYLNVSRIESGNMKYEVADFNLKNEIEGVTDDIRPTAIKQGLMLLFRTDIKSKTIVSADVGKTIQIAHNLINNSIKYTPKGTITVCMRDDLKNKTISVDITDTGIGMSQVTIDKLFQKFSRADDANDINKSGSGLGLFVASRMAEAMGGTITAHSKGKGEGSRFTLILPLAM